MKDMDYAYAVARIRANEAKMLSQAEFEQLIAAPNVNACMEILRSKSVAKTAEEGIDELIDRLGAELWTLLNECAPDKNELKVFCLQNDFFNIKAAIKCALSGISPEPFFKQPTSLDLDKLKRAGETRDFSSLGEPYSSAAEKAFDIAAQSESGQAAELVIDKATLSTMSEYAAKMRDGITPAAIDFIIGCSNAKIALRAAKAKKGADFLAEGLCECGILDIQKLAKCAVEGKNAVEEYLLHTELKQGAQLLSQSSAQFEKWADDRLIEIIKGAKYIFFGFEPLCAYYFAKSNEIKMLSLILHAKASGLSDSVIKERMRQLYV